MENFFKRLASFKQWHRQGYISAAVLAKCGFYYDEQAEILICFKCNTKVQCQEYNTHDCSTVDSKGQAMECDDAVAVVSSPLRGSECDVPDGMVMQHMNNSYHRQKDQMTQTDTQSLEELVASQRSELERYEEQKHCRVCLYNEVCTVLTPCGHVCVCDHCATRTFTCPVCRADVRKIIRIYFP